MIVVLTIIVLCWAVLLTISYSKLGILRNHRIVETRESVYTIEEWRHVQPLIPFWYGWVADRNDFGLAEHNFSQACRILDDRVKRQQAEYYRRNPPEGYPKVAKTYTVVEYLDEGTSSKSYAVGGESHPQGKLDERV